MQSMVSPFYDWLNIFKAIILCDDRLNISTMSLRKQISTPKSQLPSISSRFSIRSFYYRFTPKNSHLPLKATPEKQQDFDTPIK